MEISINAPKKRFDAHLELKDNNRILFSGKFGAGKSYFLDKYFKEQEYRYNVFNLSPVNYVVGANQDIFEWIKVDIATHYLTFHHIPDKNTFDEKESRLLRVSTYIHNNYSTIFKRLVESIITKTISDDTSLDIKEEIAAYKKWDKEIGDKTEDVEKLYSLLSNEKDKIGSIYEEDINTLVLRRAIKSLKDDNPNKESILIIDDLDRLDPEHIFRILNVLSVHNYDSGENKFGFDKVIVVCDLDNIKHIYGHKYGSETDFNGYIAKFYSTKPYLYVLDELISYETGKLSFTENAPIVKTTLDIILKYFINNNTINIRNLSKIDSKNIRLTKSEKLKIDTNKIKNYLDEYKGRIENQEYIVNMYNFINKNPSEYYIDICNFKGIQLINYLIEVFGGLD